ncbi:M17 family metallopeptidase [Pimelobacter simplex]|uniref:M17 family metallopeptidase n=1 Tax=Nocardioides simplex TaxID=2045 RepID=UPI003AABDCFA
MTPESDPVDPIDQALAGLPEPAGLRLIATGDAPDDSAAWPAGATAEEARAWGGEAAQRSSADPGPAVDLTRADPALLPVALEGVLDQGYDGDVVVTDPTTAAPLLERAHAVSRAVRLTRRIVDARANQCPPPRFAEIAEAVARTHGLGYRLSGPDRLRDLGMGGILAIGAGSTEPALMVELWSTPGRPPGDTPAPGSVALIGKGVTFDSGGLSLKPPAAQVGMHTDKAGAATVLGALSALAALDVPVPVHAVLPVVENLPGPGAVRPGDVVTTRNGLGVEIVDTDFEGRVIMADALAWAAEHRPRAVLDIATLTYQATIALGPSIGALIARDRALGAQVLAAAERSGEPLWGLPWAPRYSDQVRSSAPGATVRNHPGTDTGRALTAALFLGAFVPEDLPWVHLDVAGPAVGGSGADGRATGFGVRTLVELLRTWEPAR